MTRENKLALVVGFGLILLVGILVSDHFSAARSQEPAELSQALDPLSATRADNPELIALRTERTGPRGVDLASLGGGPGGDPSPGRGFGGGFGGYDAAGNATADSVRADLRRRAVDPVVPESPEAIVMGVGPAGGIGLAPAEAERLPYTFHHVGKNENLSAICSEHYGDASLALALARYNDLKDPNSIQLGQRLRIPRADDLVRGRTIADTAAAPTRTGPPAAAAARSATAKDATYTVKEGDVLTEIARTLLGSARKYQAIYEANRDQLDSPDDIREGMTLRIPR